VERGFSESLGVILSIELANRPRETYIVKLELTLPHIMLPRAIISLPCGTLVISRRSRPPKIRVLPEEDFFRD
jgi:hypothetical protein